MKFFRFRSIASQRPFHEPPWNLYQVRSWTHSRCNFFSISEESYWWFPEIRVPLVIIHFERWDFPLSTLQLLGDPHDYGNPHIILNHVIFTIIHQQPSLNLHNHSPMTMETPVYNIIPLWNTVHIPLNPYWLFLMMINDGYLMEIPHVFPLLTIIYHITTMY